MVLCPFDGATQAQAMNILIDGSSVLNGYVFCFFILFWAVLL